MKGVIGYASQLDGLVVLALTTNRTKPAILRRAVDVGIVNDRGRSRIQCREEPAQFAPEYIFGRVVRRLHVAYISNEWIGAPYSARPARVR